MLVTMRLRALLSATDAGQVPGGGAVVSKTKTKITKTA
jgi:hypothetical protein